MARKKKNKKILRIIGWIAGVIILALLMVAIVQVFVK